ncbi:MAG: hypothetical protein WA816_12750 [Bacteroidales bacterium]
MKKSSRTLYFLILIMIASSMPLKLLSQFGPGVPPGGSVYGYVLLSSGDTLEGLVRWKLKYVENNLAEIMFTAKNGNSKIFDASEIYGFGHIFGKDLKTSESSENENYESVPSLKKGIPVFMYRFLDGRLKVFQHRSIQGMSSGFDEKSSKIDGISFSLNWTEGLTVGSSYKTSYRTIAERSGCSSYLVRKDKGKLLDVNKNNYENIFPALFGDCPEIGKEIEKNPELSRFKYFMILTEVYNQICKGSFQSH